MVLASVLQRLRGRPRRPLCALTKRASFPAAARPWTAAVRQCISLDSILHSLSHGHAATAYRPQVLRKHSCATTAEVKILHWEYSQLEMPTPPYIAIYLYTPPSALTSSQLYSCTAFQRSRFMLRLTIILDCRYTRGTSPYYQSRLSTPAQRPVPQALASPAQGEALVPTLAGSRAREDGTVMTSHRRTHLSPLNYTAHLHLCH